uniref:SH3 domain-containing protein n=1 Tax=Arcella intermedia TaxID=1963864 RepID=A0A6B2LS47_9EUKA
MNFVEVFFPVGSKGIVEHDFLAEDEEELPLKTGEELTLISSSPDGWWRGKNEMGEIGLFPQNYVRLKETPQLQNPK